MLCLQWAARKVQVCLSELTSGVFSGVDESIWNQHDSAKETFLTEPTVSVGWACCCDSVHIKAKGKQQQLLTALMIRSLLGAPQYVLSIHWVLIWKQNLALLAANLGLSKMLTRPSHCEKHDRNLRGNITLQGLLMSLGFWIWKCPWSESCLATFDITFYLHKTSGNSLMVQKHHLGGWHCCDQEHWPLAFV